MDSNPILLQPNPLFSDTAARNGLDGWVGQCLKEETIPVRSQKTMKNCLTGRLLKKAESSFENLMLRQAHQNVFYESF